MLFLVHLREERDRCVTRNSSETRDQCVIPGFRNSGCSPLREQRDLDLSVHASPTSLRSGKAWVRQTWALEGALVIAALLATAGCKREERGFQVAPPSANQADGLRLTSLQAGGRSPTPPVNNQYEENAYALSEGKRLYSAFNCVGCHAHGGGDKGPALIDDKWIYGSRPEQIFATIMEGRPNGMPSFRGKLPEHQAWQLAAYVRSMSGQVRKDVAPQRDDAMKTNPPENSVDPVKPRDAGSPR